MTNVNQHVCVCVCVCVGGCVNFLTVKYQQEKGRNNQTQCELRLKCVRISAETNLLNLKSIYLIAIELSTNESI